MVLFYACDSGCQAVKEDVEEVPQVEVSSKRYSIDNFDNGGVGKARQGKNTSRNGPRQPSKQKNEPGSTTAMPRILICMPDCSCNGSPDTQAPEVIQSQRADLQSYRPNLGPNKTLRSAALLPRENSNKVAAEGAIEEGSEDRRENRPVHKFSDGRTYKGQWMNDQPDGWGVQEFPDGGKYSGDFRKSRATGLGTFEYPNGDLYMGEWHADRAHGRGQHWHSNGGNYLGEWNHGAMQGQGAMTFADGSTYVGQWEEGLKSGTGTFTWSNSAASGSRRGCVYEGAFLNDQFDGKGKHKWPDGRTYEGEWRIGRMSGQGVFSFKDGRRYEGQYEGDQKNGRGVFTWPDGRKYDGEFSQGKQHGQGTYREKTGQTKSGRWDMGTYVSKGNKAPG